MGQKRRDPGRRRDPDASSPDRPASRSPRYLAVGALAADPPARRTWRLASPANSPTQPAFRAGQADRSESRGPSGCHVPARRPSTAPDHHPDAERIAARPVRPTRTDRGHPRRLAAGRAWLRDPVTRSGGRHAGHACSSADALEPADELGTGRGGGRVRSLDGGGGCAAAAAGSCRRPTAGAGNPRGWRARRRSGLYRRRSSRAHVVTSHVTNGALGAKRTRATPGPRDRRIIDTISG